MNQIVEWDRLPRSSADRISYTNRYRLSGPGFRTFTAIADLWGLTLEQRCRVLGMPAPSTYRAWSEAARRHRDVTLDVDVLTRISAVLGIHQALGVLHGDDGEGVAWLRGPYAAVPFVGRAPLDMAVDGTLEGLLTVRRFLDALLQGQATEPNAVDRDFQPYTTADIAMS